MNSLPLVSIVTPSFNQANFLEETIDSVLGQDYPNLEYIIVDGGSTDSSLDVIQKYASKLAWWISEPDAGQTDALNKGFAHAHGEILAWLNSDDTYLPGAIQAAVKVLVDQPQLGLVYGDANLVDLDGNVIGRFPAKQTSYRRLMRGYVHIPQQAAFFRASVWKEVGPLDPTFYFAMDYDLWVRIAKRKPILHVPGLWANFRLHQEGKSTIADARCWPEMLRVHKREGGNWLSIMRAKAMLRSLTYSRFPVSWRVWLRQYFALLFVIVLKILIGGQIGFCV